MGSETKVGLLVGMCFIVCFAIILAHRGAADPQRPRPAFEITTADSPAAQPTRAHTPAESPAPVREATRTPARQNAPTTDLPRRRTAPPAEPTAHFAQADNAPAATRAPDPGRFTRRTDPVPAPTAINRLAQLLNSTEDHATADVEAAERSPQTQLAEANPASPQATAEPWLDAGRQVADALASAGYTLSSRVQEEQLRRQASTSQENIQQAEPAAPERPETREAAAPVVREAYVVQAGDTLSRIARQKYGSDHPSIVDAIFAANHDRMSSPDKLVVGKELRLPEIADAPLASAAAPTTPESTTPPTEADPARALREELARMNPGEDQPARPSTSGTTHVVQPGETLSRIVRSHYGSADPALIRAVFEANRKQMKNPNAIVAGMKLVLPDRGHSAGAVSADDTLFAAAETAAPETTAPDAEAPAVAAAARERWYVIQPGDLLSTVAQKELGSSRRWHEIAQLNKKAFPDPSRIRSGARIRLPLDGMQTADASVAGVSR